MVHIEEAFLVLGVPQGRFASKIVRLNRPFCSVMCYKPEVPFYRWDSFSSIWTFHYRRPMGHLSYQLPYSTQSDCLYSVCRLPATVTFISSTWLYIVYSFTYLHMNRFVTTIKRHPMLSFTFMLELSCMHTYTLFHKLLTGSKVTRYITLKPLNGS